MILLLTSQDIKSLLDVKDFLEIVEESYKLVGHGLIKMLPELMWIPTIQQVS